MKFRLLLPILMTILSCAESQAQEIVSISERLLHTLDSIASKDVPAGAPGIATGIVLDGQIIYERSYGFADLTDSTKINSSSRFNIASNGKQYTAIAIMTLIENDQLCLSDDLRSFLPGLFATVEDSIQIKHLLNHSSGIRDVYDLWSLQGLTWWEHTFDNTDGLALIGKQNDLNFRPGSKYSYSNTNYILLAMIVEKITGVSFIEYTKQLFRSVDMPNTSFVSDYKNIDGPIAKPYFNFNTWFGYDWIWNIYGDGNLFSSLSDQLQWERVIQAKKGGYFSNELLAQSQALVPGTGITEYGYGLEFGEHRGMSYQYHGGATGAWKAITVRFPQFNLSIVTLTNSGKTDPMSQTLQMVDAMFGIDSKVTSFITEPQKAGGYVSKEDVVGIYQTNFGYIMKFVVKEDDLYMQRSGRNEIKLLRESDNVFYQWNDAPFKQEFTKNENGQMVITAYYTTVPPFSLTRIESDLSNFKYKKLEGKFQNTETDVSFQMKYQEQDTYQIIIGDQEMSALLLTPSEVLVNDYRLTFTADQTGAINEIYLTSGRIQNVKFERVN